MFNVVICDDDNRIVKIISGRLKANLDPLVKYTSYEYTDPKDVISLSKRVQIHLLIIDIVMPEYSGFRVVEEIMANKQSALIIFVSDFDNYVYESLKFRPFRFVRKTYLHEINEALTSAADELIYNRETFTIPIDSNANKIVEIKDIVYFESLRNNLKVILKDGTYIFRSTLKMIEEQLVDKNFVRIHSGFLVNLEYIHLIKGNTLELSYNKTKIVLPLSRSRRNNLISEYRIFFNKQEEIINQGECCFVELQKQYKMI